MRSISAIRHIYRARYRSITVADDMSRRCRALLERRKPNRLIVLLGIPLSRFRFAYNVHSAAHRAAVAAAKYGDIQPHPPYLALRVRFAIPLTAMVLRVGNLRYNRIKQAVMAMPSNRP